MSKAERKHPYLTGNFAPISIRLTSKPCYFKGTIPEEFLGGQYVRNGTNPIQRDNPRGFHWFDGDGMLTGVYFKRISGPAHVQPVFTNEYVLTDIHCATMRDRRLYPIMPSVKALTNPVSSTIRIMYEILRSMALIFASICGLIARPIKRVSSANTSIFHHDGRVMATNEVGPPMRVFLPLLKTVGWFTGNMAEGEPVGTDACKEGFGSPGMEGAMKEMTTAHPRVDPQTGELLLFHSTFIPPFVNYSIIPARTTLTPEYRLNRPVPGLISGKMMHDFGVSHRHTIIIDLPLELDLSNIIHGKPVVEYNPQGQTRLGVFPRHVPELIRWFTTEPCVVMHTVNTWDDITPGGTWVNMLLCRMNSVAPFYHMGNIAAPDALKQPDPQCRLYYYEFPPSHEGTTSISQQWALSAIPFEFPCVPKHLEMDPTRYVYGSSMRKGNFAATHISAFKIDCLVKMDVEHLLSRGKTERLSPVDGCVDERSIDEVLASDNPDDPIKVFAFPTGWYAQECSFVPRKDARHEDDGWLVTYVFDESQLDENGEAPPDARSELWVIDAVGMREVVCRVVLPQRVPYGMHGNWFSEEQIVNQRDVDTFRHEY
ncbi:hypothetical protein AtubIFM55763_000812 [Aspergillus tubingensis]|uniref:9-cis-epoxycarotenoid dioxygenase n=2 Tax=Aspergillus subgen. Circumdati TaxID=2720871 RepID=A0A100ISC4_ASPNG|nr:9-cis-epoxycarotenoid dioxygenase [Aspergillus tubingensis]GAQ46429.1 9-cis-epoxycarotenoid dioxygenase [Aspergillus niger]GFN13885.1 9-cis-epoxycarotenoid dioxygenase [Aspergillus tubingensis]GLA67382.1 hypothetical protein AtubIFM54640_010700 [Aspergillus tubingensis]GLA70642.1 hypothetical protein AtubIFM55763_000812 [Aspergillus tubingensis]GLA80802.1 hypothetical protein AtubIFM56815_004433 [Aspergillus tubingensis]